MADGRMLKKAISNSRRLAKLSSDTFRLIYTWLIPHLDVEGRFTAEPSIIKGNVFPRIKTINEKVIRKALEEMSRVDLITVYSIDGDSYLQLRKFEYHQTGLRKEREAPSKIPPPTPEQLQNNSRVILENSGLSLREVKEKRREVKEKGSEGNIDPRTTSDVQKWENQLIEIFNSVTQFLPKITSLSSGRLQKIRLRKKEKPDFEWWKVVFEKADLVLIPGKDGRKDWYPTFDWLIKNDTNAIKVFEGNYDDAKRPPPMFSAQPGMDAWLKRKLEEDPE